jgi:hypothetical protein
MRRSVTDQLIAELNVLALVDAVQPLKLSLPNLKLFGIEQRRC